MSLIKARMLKLVALLVVGAFLLPMLINQAAAQDAGKSLRVHQPLYPATIDPQKSSFSQEIAILVANYEGLTRPSSDLQVAPAAAERWEPNADGSAWTFTLRAGLTYSDGSPLTAERFRYAAERACDPNTAGDYQYVLFDIAGCAEFASLYAADAATPVAPDDTAAYEAAKAALGVKAIDDRTLEVTLNGPAPYFPSIAGLWVFFPAKQELIEAGGDAWWVDPANQIGNGPFQVTSIDEEQLVTFAANENYWAGPPALDGIEYVYVPDGAVALEAYRAGDLDIVNPDPSLYPVIEGEPILSQELVRYAGANSFMYAFDVKREPFNDHKVREAFTYGFDRQTFCDVVVNGDCVPVQSWVPPGIPGAIETDMFAFDRERARQALAESSYGGPENLPEVVYSFDSSIPEERPRAEWIAGNYRDVLGIELTLEPVDTQTFIEHANDPEHYLQFSGLGWIQDYPDPQNWLSLLWSCDGIFAAPAGYCNEEFDALITQADAETEMAARQPLYEEASRLLVADVPGVFAFSQANVFLVKPEVTGYDQSPLDAEWPGPFTSLTAVDVNR